MLFIPQQNPKFLPRRMRAFTTYYEFTRAFFLLSKENFVTLASTHNIHSFSGTNIHILKYYQHFFINPKYLWETSVRIFLTLPQRTFKSVGALCLNQPQSEKPEKKNGAKTKIYKHTEWDFPIHDLSQKDELRNCSNERILQGKEK